MTPGSVWLSLETPRSWCEFRRQAMGVSPSGPRVGHGIAPHRLGWRNPSPSFQDQIPIGVLEFMREAVSCQAAAGRLDSSGDYRERK